MHITDGFTSFQYLFPNAVIIEVVIIVDIITLFTILITIMIKKIPFPGLFDKIYFSGAINIEVVIIDEARDTKPHMELLICLLMLCIERLFLMK